MTTPLVRREAAAPHVERITLDRPDKRNALSSALLDELAAAIAAARGNKTRAIILAGAGKAFCTGMDLTEARDAESGERAADKIRQTLTALQEFPGVTIAAVKGAALAGGAGLMTACDLVVLEESATVGYPEVNRGLVASLVLTLLRRQVPERFIRELLLLGQAIPASRALAMGLANRVVADGAADAEACALATIAAAVSPHAVRETKSLLASLWPRSFADDLAWAAAHHVDVRKHPDFAEGLAAFFEKRTPRWHE